MLDAVLVVGQPIGDDPSVVDALDGRAEQVRVANEPPDNEALLGRGTPVGPGAELLARSKGQAGFEDQVERGFGRPAEAAVAGLLEHLAQSGLAGLGSQPERDVLGKGVGRAYGRGGGVEQSGHGVGGEVGDLVVECEWLHQQHGPARLEMLAGVAGDADRVAHIVQAVEEADQVKTAVIALRVGDLEGGAIDDARLVGPGRAVSMDGAWKSKPQMRLLG